jgi:hypothetical protein
VNPIPDLLLWENLVSPGIEPGTSESDHYITEAVYTPSNIHIMVKSRGETGKDIKTHGVNACKTPVGKTKGAPAKTQKYMGR